MLKQSFTYGLIYSIGNFITRGISVLLVPFYTRVLSPEDYGILDMIFLTGVVTGIFFALEITQAVTRFIPELQTKKSKKDYLSSALWYMAFSYSIFLLFCFIFRDQLSGFIFNKDGLEYIFFVGALSITAYRFYYFFQNELRANLKVKVYTINSVFVSLLTITLTIVFLLILNLNVEGVLYAQIISYSIASLWIGYYSRDYFGFSFDANKLKELMLFSLPLVPSTLGVFISMYTDRILISRILSLNDVGIYALAYKLAFVVNLLVIGFQSSINPLIFKKYKLKDTPSQIEKTFKYYMAVGITLYVSLSIFSEEILVILTTPDYYAAAPLVPFLVLTVLFSSLNVFSPGLNIAKKTSIIAYINIFVAFVNLLMTYLTILYIGIIGAAFTTAFTTIVGYGLYVIFSSRLYRVKLAHNKVAAAIMLSSLVIFITFQYIAFGLVLNIILKTLISLVTITAVVVLLIGKKETKYIIERARLEIAAVKKRLS